MKILYYPRDHDEGSKPTIEPQKHNTGTPDDPTFEWHRSIEHVEIDGSGNIVVYTGTFYFVFTQEEFERVYDDYIAILG